MRKQWAKAEIGSFLEALLSPLCLHLSWLTTVYERDVSGSGLKRDAHVSKQLNSWEIGARSKVRKEEMDSTQGFGLRQPQRWQSFQVERGKTIWKESGCSAALGSGCRWGLYWQWWMMNREGGDSWDFPSKWIADLSETWQEENKSCLWSSNVQSSFLSFTICVSFWNLWFFGSFILISPQVWVWTGQDIYVATVLSSSDLDYLRHLSVASVTQLSDEDGIAKVLCSCFGFCMLMCTCWN